jgi:mannose-6-phosphate isomerase-like protein (cupin superfamily)
MAKAKKKAKARSAAKSAARKTSSMRKTSTRKTSGRRKVATRATSARRKPAAKSARTSSAKSARKAASKVAKKAAAPPRRPPQKVAISHYNNADFETGLRSYAQYRDLGMVEATHGMVRAHVLRFTEPCDPKVVSKLHFHDTEFQMVYVLKGWVKTELGGEEVTMRQGSSWTQPPKIRHKINDYSEDAELLEIILPADFETEELAG